jgi:hypothetical protein
MTCRSGEVRAHPTPTPLDQNTIVLLNIQPTGIMDHNTIVLFFAATFSGWIFSRHAQLYVEKGPTSRYNQPSPDMQKTSSPSCGNQMKLLLLLEKLDKCYFSCY